MHERTEGADAQASPPSSSNDRSAPDNSDKKIAGMHRSTAILGLITAIVTLGGVIVGLFASHAVSQRNDASSGLESAQSSLHAANSSLSAANESISTLQQQLSDAQSNSATPGVGPSGSVAPTSVNGIPRNNNPAVIANGEGIDLDGKNGDWTGGDGKREFTWLNGDMLYNFGKLVQLDKPANYKTCHTSGYGSPRISVNIGEPPPLKTYFCAQTSGNRYVALQLTEIDRAQIAFAAISYDPPYQSSN
jgi:hypothetical protein